MRKFLAIILVLIIAAATYFWVQSNAHTDLDKLPPLESGDLIFHTIADDRMLPTLFSGASKYDHVGIVSKNADDYTVISELTNVSEMPLASFVKSGWGEKVTILRYNGLNDMQRKLVALEAQYLAHNPHFALHANTTGIYCCEFPYAVFSTLNFPMGQEQKMAEMGMNNPIAEHLFHFHSLCKQNDNYDACWESIMNTPVITPESIIKDTRLTVIYSNYP